MLGARCLVVASARTRARCLFRGYTGSRDRLVSSQCARLGARTVRVHSRAHEHAARRTLRGRQTRRRAPLSVAAGTNGAGAGCPAQARDVCHGSPKLAASFLSLCALIWFIADMLTPSPRPPSPLPYQNFLMGVTAKSKLPMHLMAPLLDRCEITFVAPPAPVPLSPCTMYTRLDTRVYPCQFTNDHKVLKALCDTWTNLEVSLCSGLFARHSCLPIPISRCRPRRT